MKKLYFSKCQDRVRDILWKARDKARKKAAKGETLLHPWWCNKELWDEMTAKWAKEDWQKKSKAGSANRSSGGEGGRAPVTYRGGTKSTVQYCSEQVI